MASTFSPTLRLELIGDGDQSGIWGQTTNNNLGALVEQAITGVATIAMVDANYTLANFNGVVDEARNQVLILTGALSQQRNLIAPLVEKTYIIRNTTTGGFGVQIIGPSGTGVIIPNGTTASVFCDGSNFFPATTGSLGNQVINGNLAVTGTTTLTGALSASTATFSGAISSVNPSFTGTPTAPTAIAGTNTTQIATTAFVQNVAGALGTMSTQNANAVAITGGSINGTTIGASTAASIAGTTGNFSGNLASLGSVSGATGVFGAVSGTTITASTQFNGPGTGLTGTAGSLSIGGNAATATNAVTVTGTTQNNITSIPNLATVGTISSGTWSGSFGAVSGANLTNLNASNLASGTVAAARLSGTYNIDISGNAATATNAINATNATNATTATSANQFQGRTKLGLGITGETWTYPSRGFGTTYTNSESYPIAVSATATCAFTSTILAYVNGSLVAWYQWQFNQCFAPDTKIRLWDGSVHTLLELEGKEVELRSLTEDMQIVKSKGKITLTHPDIEVMNVYFSDGTVITCTKIHKFVSVVSKYVNKLIYLQADNLVRGDLIYRNDDAPIMVTNVEFTGQVMDTYCPQMEEYHNFELANGMFTHNCGSFGGTFIIVPPGATYRLDSSQGVYNWTELR